TSAVPLRIESHKDLLLRFTYELRRQCTLFSPGNLPAAPPPHPSYARARPHPTRYTPGPAMREICGENLVHSIPVFNFHQKDIRLNHAVHGSTANLHELFDLIHHHGGVGFNRPFLLIPGVVSALAGDEDQTVIENYRHNDLLLAGFAFAVQLADPSGLRSAGALSKRTAGRSGGSNSQSG